MGGVRVLHKLVNWLMMILLGTIYCWTGLRLNCWTLNSSCWILTRKKCSDQSPDGVFTSRHRQNIYLTDGTAAALIKAYIWVDWIRSGLKSWRLSGQDHQGCTEAWIGSADDNITLICPDDRFDARRADRGRSARLIAASRCALRVGSSAVFQPLFFTPSCVP